jgi:ubiquinone/menaquinone biosynthesis C-methylase UbiE
MNRRTNSDGNGHAARPTRRHWDRQASSYDRAKERNRFYFETVKHLCREHLGDTHAMRILEVGCGTGDILSFLEPASGLGVDLSPEMVEIARRKHGHRPELDFAVGTAEKLPAENRDFDAVVMCDLIEHVDDVQQALRAPAAVLKEGGLLFVSTSNPLWAFPLWLLETLRLKMPEGPHRWVPLQEISNVLKREGYVIRRTGYRTLLPVRIPLLSPLLNKALANCPSLQHAGLTQFVLAAH